MKQLYAVTIERTIMVMAESEDDAESLAERHERNELGNDPDLISTRLATDKRDIPPAWLDCFPYGGDGDQNCEQLFKSQATSKQNEVI